MNFCDSVSQHLTIIEGKAGENEEMIRRLPPGTLRCWRNGDNYTWNVLLPDGRALYLPKTEHATAVQLAAKRVLEYELHDLKRDINACKRYIAAYLKGEAERTDAALYENSELITLAAEARELSGPSFNPDKWKVLPYKKSEKYKSGLVIPTASGMYVRSKSEAMIATELDILNIPYHYEQLHRIGGVDYYPDFTAWCEKTNSFVLIEYFGKMDDPKYLRKFSSKISTYTAGGYIPDINLLCFFETNEHPLDIRQVRSRLENMFY